MLQQNKPPHPLLSDTNLTVRGTSTTCLTCAPVRGRDSLLAAVEAAREEVAVAQVQALGSYQVAEAWEGCTRLECHLG